MKIYSRFYLLGSLSCFFVLLVSCSLSDELDKISGINSIEATGSFNANVLNETLYLKDLISIDNLDLKVDPITGYYIFGFENSSNYKMESIVFPKINVDPLYVKLPSEYTNPLAPIPVGEYILPKVISTFDLDTPKIGTLEFPSGFNIKVIKLKTGAKISLTLNNDFNLGARMKVTIPTLIKDGVVYSKTFLNIPANTISNLTIDDLEGYSLNTADMAIEIQTTIIKTINNPIIGSEMIFSTIVDIADHHESVEGFFGEIVLNADPISVGVSLPDGFKKINFKDMIIKETTITLTVSKNNLTLPFDLDLLGEGIEIEKKPLDITNNNNIFEFKIKDLNILNLDQLILTPVVTLNKNLSSGYNELKDISSITFKTKVDMDIEVKDLTFEQEGDNSFYEASVKESDFEFKNGKIWLKGSINSQIPLGATIQVDYKNTTNGADSLSLFDNPIEIKFGETAFDVTITKEKLDLIKKSPFQVIKVTLNGSGKIERNQKIILKIGLAANGTIATKI